MRTIRFFLVIMILVLSAPCLLNEDSLLSAAPHPASWLNGTWSGTGFQLSNGSTWTIRFTARYAANSFIIEYPSLSCGGNWILLSSDAHIAKFTETITRGLESCLNGGLIIITRIDNDHISYSYFSLPGKALEAFSTLRRTGN